MITKNDLNKESFVGAVAAKKKAWKKELEVLVPEVPDFETVEKEVAGLKFILFG